MAKKVTGKNKNKKEISIDLTGVETGVKAIPEGTYSVKVAEAELTESQSSGAPMLKIVFEVTEGKHKGSKLFENVSLQPQALFKLKSLLTALGYDIPEGAFDLDTADLIDLECEVEVAHEKYEGRNRARIVEFIGEESDDEDDDSDEDEDEDDDEEEEEDDEEDYDSMSLKDLKALAKEKGIKVTKGMDKDEIIEALEEADDEEDDEDEEEDDDVDYESMSVKDLKALAREKGIKVKKGMGKDEIIEALEEADE